MDSTAYLFAANIAVWLGVGAYVAFLALGQRRLASRIAKLEILRHDSND